jgi:hypothetical protein
MTGDMKHPLLFKSFLCVAPFLAQGSLLAQETVSLGDQAGATCPVSFSNSLTCMSSGRTDMKGSGKGLDGISSSHVGESFGCSITVTPKLSFEAGMTYNGNFFDAHVEGAAPMVKRLQGLSSSFVANYKLDCGWTAMGGLGNGWYNSGSRFDSHGAGVEAFAGAMKVWNERLTVVFGLGYNSLAKDCHHVMPGFGIHYAFSPSWSLSVGYPETALTWKANDLFDLSLVAEGVCQTYFVHAGDIEGNRKTTPLKSGKMEYTDVRVGLRANYTVMEGLAFFVTGGYLCKREFDFFDQDYKLESGSGAPYVSIGMTGSF